ncbi:unnamed protein product [Jaminaea pallidilutea]
MKLALFVLALTALSSTALGATVTCYSDVSCSANPKSVGPNSAISGCNSYKITGSSLQACGAFAGGQCIACHGVGPGCHTDGLACWTAGPI